jgi:uncharacterized membrane protein
VGAGTGKATVLLAARGLEVLALEPSAEMARLARVNCAGHSEVEIAQSDFETWSPPQRYAGLVCFQAWHWVAADVRYVKAHDALAAGAMLAAVWALPDWERCPQRDQLRDAYRTSGVAFPADFPMHPDSEPTRLAGHWEAEIAGSGLFAAPEVRLLRWQQDYTSTRYVELLQTHQDHILLGDADRTRLLERIEQTIEKAGGTLSLPLVTHLCLARRV